MTHPQVYNEILSLINEGKMKEAQNLFNDNLFLFSDSCYNDLYNQLDKAF